MGGVFFAFSAFVMDGLARLPPERGVAAMQSINVTAVRPLFMVALFGTAALCLVLASGRCARGVTAGLRFLLAGSALYLVATIALTVVHHVPLNDALATVDPSSSGAAGHWVGYLESWTMWNHVRAAGALAAAAAFSAALTR